MNLAGIGCTPRGAYGNTAFEKVPERVLGKGSQKGSEKGVWYGFYSMKEFLRRVLRRVLRRGSEKGVSRRCLVRPLGEYAPFLSPMVFNFHPNLDR